MDNIILRNNRTIKSVLDIETGEEIDADEFFGLPEEEIWNYRRILEEAIQDIGKPKFVCCYCMQNIKIKGGAGSAILGRKAAKLHFAHYKDSDECPIKTNSKLTQSDILRFKYNGAKESEMHMKLKSLIYSFLCKNKDMNLGIESAEMESVHKSITKQWRKPDVSCKYNGINLVFELQLSTTFLSVIAARENFYKNNKEYIIWVFRKFDLESDLQKFTQKDIYYSNNRNAFILNDLAISKSEEMNNLVLLCYYQKPFIENNQIIYEWQECYVTLADLTFDTTHYKVYFYDVESDQKKLEIEIEHIKEEQAIKAKYESQQRLERAKLRKEQEEKERREKEERILALAEREEQEIKMELENIKTEEDYVEVFYNRLQKRYKTVTIFTLLFKRLNFENYSFYEEISRFFLLERYCVSRSEEDKEFLVKEFKYGKDNLFSGNCLCAVIWANCYVKCQKYEIDFNGLPNLNRLIFAIISLKIDRIVGYEANSMLDIAHKIYDVRMDNFEFYMKALKYYGWYDKILLLDKDGSFQEKVNKFCIEKPKQDEEHNQIMKCIFNEIFN